MLWCLQAPCELILCCGGVVKVVQCCGGDAGGVEVSWLVILAVLIIL